MDVIYEWTLSKNAIQLLWRKFILMNFAATSLLWQNSNLLGLQNCVSIKWKIIVWSWKQNEWNLTILYLCNMSWALLVPLSYRRHSLYWLKFLFLEEIEQKWVQRRVLCNVACYLATQPSRHYYFHRQICIFIALAVRNDKIFHFTIRNSWIPFL
jgi:hypothetical protein